MCQRLQLPVMPETDDLGADYLLAGDWMPDDQDVRDEFETEEEYRRCRCGGYGCHNCR